jgi:hypothetical protein
MGESGQEPRKTSPTYLPRAVLPVPTYPAIIGSLGKDYDLFEGSAALASSTVAGSPDSWDSGETAMFA